MLYMTLNVSERTRDDEASRVGSREPWRHATVNVIALHKSLRGHSRAHSDIPMLITFPLPGVDFRTYF